MDDGPEFVIGAEMAAAREADARRLAAGDAVPSPLPPGRYDPWSDELGSFRIVPLPYDEALTSFVRGYREMSAERRAEIRDAVGLDDAYVLLPFARRAAIFAIRSRTTAPVIDGLSACAAIGYERIDQRDALRALGCLHHAAERCGADATALFEEASAFGEPEFGRHITAFLARSSAELDLRDAWGLVEVEGPHGVGLLEWGFASWMPTLDLIGASVRVSIALRGDRYAIDDPTLAVELPAYWLSEAGDPTLEQILAAARGAALMHGRLRPDATPDHAGQQLTVWVVELSDGLAAQRLRQLSLVPHPGHALLGLTSGPLFVLAVARSAVHGVASFEHEGSLQRFEPALTTALSA